jgi:hypothetical protein
LGKRGGDLSGQKGKKRAKRVKRLKKAEKPDRAWRVEAVVYKRFGEMAVRVRGQSAKSEKKGQKE